MYIMFIMSPSSLEKEIINICYGILIRYDTSGAIISDKKRPWTKVSIKF